MERGNDLLYMLTPSGTSERSQPGAWASASSHLRKSQAKRAKVLSPRPKKPNPTGSETNCFKNKGKAGKGSRVDQPAGRDEKFTEQREMRKNLTK